MDEEDLMSTPQYKITNFNLYCTKGCCVRLDTNLIEKNKEVWMFGYLKCHIASSARYGYSSFDGGEIALHSGAEDGLTRFFLFLSFCVCCLGLQSYFKFIFYIFFKFMKITTII